MSAKQNGQFRQIRRLFKAPLARPHLFTRINLSTTMAKVRQIRQIRQNFHRLTNLVKSHKIVNKILSNMPFSLLRAGIFGYISIW